MTDDPAPDDGSPEEPQAAARMPLAPILGLLAGVAVIGVGIAAISIHTLAARFEEKALSSRPSGAEILVGGTRLGKTPGTLQVPVGTPLDVELRLPGYQTDFLRVNSTDPSPIVVTLAPVAR